MVEKEYKKLKREQSGRKYIDTRANRRLEAFNNHMEKLYEFLNEIDASEEVWDLVLKYKSFSMVIA